MHLGRSITACFAIVRIVNTGRISDQLNNRSLWGFAIYDRVTLIHTFNLTEYLVNGGKKSPPGSYEFFCRVINSINIDSKVLQTKI